MPDPPEVGSIWFDDGNLIVIAEPKVFRLYQGLLARRSPVLKDLLSIPGANNVIDEADRRILHSVGRDTAGCAVVRFTDKPPEVEWFLSAFLGDSVLCQFSGDITALTGILRLAAKYEVNFLRKWTVECLEHALKFTTELDAGQLSKLMKPEDAGGRWMNGLFPLIDVANAVGVPWLLPIVFWRLQDIGPSDFIHHPEWQELTEERKLDFLLVRESAQDDAFNVFAVVIHLYRDGSTHDAIPDKNCMNMFKDALFTIFVQAGPLAVKVNWESYVMRLSCGMCKERYNTLKRKMVIEAFAALQKHMGLPEHREMMEQREKYFQHVSTHDA